MDSEVSAQDFNPQLLILKYRALISVKSSLRKNAMAIASATKPTILDDVSPGMADRLTRASFPIIQTYYPDLMVLIARSSAAVAPVMNADRVLGMLSPTPDKAESAYASAVALLGTLPREIATLNAKLGGQSTLWKQQAAELKLLHQDLIQAINVATQKLVDSDGIMKGIKKEIDDQSDKLTKNLEEEIRKGSERTEEILAALGRLRDLIKEGLSIASPLIEWNKAHALQSVGIRNDYEHLRELYVRLYQHKPIAKSLGDLGAASANLVGTSDNLELLVTELSAEWSKMHSSFEKLYSQSKEKSGTLANLKDVKGAISNAISLGWKDLTTALKALEDS